MAKYMYTCTSQFQTVAVQFHYIQLQYAILCNNNPWVPLAVASALHDAITPCISHPREKQNSLMVQQSHFSQKIPDCRFSQRGSLLYCYYQVPHKHFLSRESLEMRLVVLVSFKSDLPFPMYGRLNVVNTHVYFDCMGNLKRA